MDILGACGMLVTAVCGFIAGRIVASQYIAFLVRRIADLEDDNEALRKMNDLLDPADDWKRQ